MPKVTREKRVTKKRVVKRRVKSKGILSRLEDFNDFKPSIKMAVYGRSGTGKTTFWSSFPGKIMVIVADTQSKDELISIATKEVKAKLKIFVLNESGEIHEIVNELKNKNNFKTIVLDNVTDIQFLVLKELLDLDEVPTQLSWGIASQQQWGQVTSKTKEIIRNFYSIDCNCIIVAHERSFNVELDGDTLIRPYIAAALTPGSVGFLNSKSNYVVNTFQRPEIITTTTKKRIKGKLKVIEKETDTGRVEYCMRVEPDPIYTVKFRRPKDTKKRDPVLLNPDYDKIIKLIEG